MKLDMLLENMDLKFFATGEAGISPEVAVELIGNEDIFFLDVRTTEECRFVKFPFAHHIPINEIPFRLKEIPEDRLIIIFCSCVVRASVTYAYLLEKGYKNVKVLVGTIEDLASMFTPKSIYGKISN